MCLAHGLTGVFSSSSGNVALFSGEIKLKTPAAVSELSQNQKVNLNRDGVPGESMPSSLWSCSQISSIFVSLMSGPVNIMVVDGGYMCEEKWESTE